MDSGICIHSDGSGLNTCDSMDPSSLNICKQKCSSFPSCLGFSYAPKPTDVCELYIPNEKCPDDFLESFEDRFKFAKTSDDLKGTTKLGEDDWDEYNGCYRKISGKSNQFLWHINFLFMR